MFTYIKLKDIKRGQRFIERCAGRLALFEAYNPHGHGLHLYLVEGQ